MITLNKCDQGTIYHIFGTENWRQKKEKKNVEVYPLKEE